MALTGSALAGCAPNERVSDRARVKWPRIGSAKSYSRDAVAHRRGLAVKFQSFLMKRAAAPVASLVALRKECEHCYVGILAITARTWAADHAPPRGAEIPRPFSSFAIERSEFAPAVRMSPMTGARSAARDVAASDLARRALAQSAAVPARPQNPPSRLAARLRRRKGRARAMMTFRAALEGTRCPA